MTLQALQVIVLADFVSLTMVRIYNERSLFVKQEMQKFFTFFGFASSFDGADGGICTRRPLPDSGFRDRRVC